MIPRNNRKLLCGYKISRQFFLKGTTHKCNFRKLGGLDYTNRTSLFAFIRGLQVSTIRIRQGELQYSTRMNRMQQIFYNIVGMRILHYTERNILIYHSSQKDFPTPTKKKRNGTRSEKKGTNPPRTMTKGWNPSRSSAFSCKVSLSPESTMPG